jgi:hypothetical protein
MITQFTVLGERCSGTNYLAELLKLNFDLQLHQPYWKHGFQAWPPPSPEEAETTLYVGICRGLEPWLESLFREQHHLTETKDRWKFLTQKAKLDPDRLPIIPPEAVAREQYPSLFALHSSKQRYLRQAASHRYPHFVLLQYEALRARPISALQMLRARFNLPAAPAFPSNYTLYKDTNEPYATVKRRDYIGEPLIRAAKTYLYRLGRLDERSKSRRSRGVKFFGSRH